MGFIHISQCGLRLVVIYIITTLVTHHCYTGDWSYVYTCFQFIGGLATLSQFVIDWFEVMAQLIYNLGIPKKVICLDMFLSRKSAHWEIVSTHVSYNYVINCWFFVQLLEQYIDFCMYLSEIPWPLIGQWGHVTWLTNERPSYCEDNNPTNFAPQC